ncbi:hypothetical protein [Xanthomonas graminis]|jgi:hypothetical protein|uniref:hypothetical protein n=1 Tax=Xanthomonas graminis TaxID=3390026 RepID=UPI0012DA6D16|nr:hypothetical protein [Xanthomonas translucens]UKE55379.1 hypothetical protein KFS84_06280 [Xanthomonas translucens pv. graminis]WIH09754.1 hypothetical protein KM579_06900 [Xanthomonas translucens pv. graminis]WIH11513.1 hypothetical protein KM563_15110 [Xanthomonas translucens pv. graminis]
MSLDSLVARGRDGLIHTLMQKSSTPPVDNGALAGVAEAMEQVIEKPKKLLGAY